MNLFVYLLVYLLKDMKIGRSFVFWSLPSRSKGRLLLDESRLLFGVPFPFGAGNIHRLYLAGSQTLHCFLGFYTDY